jgi:hypothetical protein
MRTITFTVLTLAAALWTLALPATVAFGRAPTLEELPTVKKLQADADKAIEERRKAEIEARKDPVMDAIHAYRDKAVPMTQWKDVADILKEDRETSEHRRAAAEALCERFKELTGSDQRITKLKKEIASSILPKLNDNNSTEVRIWVNSVFVAFWPGTAGKIDFNPEESNFKKRYDAWKEWRKFLKGR